MAVRGHQYSALLCPRIVLLFVFFHFSLTCLRFWVWGWGLGLVLVQQMLRL